MIGAVLRTFSFTRKLGGLLLAMAISLYFIFPAFYAFGALIVLDMKNDPGSERMAKQPTAVANPTLLNDPPIINTMYIKSDGVHGDIPMIGGGSSTVSYADIKQKLHRYEAWTPSHTRR